MSNVYKVEDFLEHVKKSKSKNTYKAYTQAIKKFSEFYGKSPDEILEERRQNWISGDLFKKKQFKLTLEEYHKWLIDKGYTQNTATSLIDCFLPLFAFYEMPILDLPGEITQRAPTTKDYVPTIEQYREMFKVADNLKEKLTISMALDLGWRIGDFAKQKKSDLPNLDQEAPISYELITQKEEVLAKSFLSQQTVDLLKDYLETIKNNPNPYLFPSNSEGYYSEESINRSLRELGQKANIQIPKTKKLRFHCFRKRFLSTCADLHIDVNTAKILVGKDVEESMLPYLSEVDHRIAFIQVHERLKLTEETALRKTKEPTTELEKRLELLERKINLMSALDPDIERKADAMLRDLGIVTAISEDMTFNDKLEMILRKKEEKQQAEYKRMIEENNNNNNNH